MLPALVPGWAQALYPKRIWKIPTDRKVLYLTFDDGPHPFITPKVLDLLAQYNAKATFFCIGDCIERSPSVFERIIQMGHAVGSHGYHHLNGWKTNVDSYINDVFKAAEVIPSKLFRPPYGRLSSRQARSLILNDFQIVMWTILSGDYDSKLSHKQCAKRVIENIEPGAIALFHDSEKAEKNMFFALETVLKFASANGYIFEVIKQKGSA